MIGYASWTDNSVQMHMALDGPAAVKALLGPAFEYPFLEGEKKMVIGITPSDNVRALQFNRHVGFREVYREADAFADGVDLVVQRMTRDEWERLRKDKPRVYAHG
jgi:hypothetical protein